MMTVRVRIAVAVATNGAWAASGWAEPNETDSDGYLRTCALKMLRSYEGQAHTVWVEADVPLPEVAAVEGVIVEEAT